MGTGPPGRTWSLSPDSRAATVQRTAESDSLRLADSAGWSLRHAFDAVAEPTLMLSGPAHQLVYQNEASVSLLGARPQLLPVNQAFPDLAEDVLALLARAWQHGEPVTLTGVRLLRDPAHAAAATAVNCTCVPICERDGTPWGIALIAVDATDKALSRQSAARLAVLSQVSDVVAGALDLESALSRFADALVPELGDAAAVYLVDPDLLAAVRRDGADDRRMPADLIKRVAVAVDASVKVMGGPAPIAESRTRSHPVVQALLSHQPVIAPVDADTAARWSTDPRLVEWLLGIGMRSLVAVPMRVADDVVGAIALMTRGVGAPFTDQDSVFLTEVARRAAPAVAQARAYQRERRTALTLQRALLPPYPRQIAGLEVAARYVAGGSAVEVGGDWWDAIDLGAGRMGFGVGDVAGHGVHAAAIMGQLRTALRTAASADLPAVDSLRLLDGQLAELLSTVRQEEGIVEFATALYATFEPHDGLLRIAVAGHLPPLIITPDGMSSRIDTDPGAPLGLHTGKVGEVAVPLPAKATVALFTDGLVEDRQTDIDDGIERLSDSLTRHLDGCRPLDEVVDRVLDDLDRRAGHDDDVALLLVRFTPDVTPVAAASVEVTSAEDVRRARGAASDVASRAGLTGLVGEAALVAGELTTNALSHAPAPALLRVYATLTRLVIEVFDPGGRLPHRAHPATDDEHGRGLAVVEHLSDRWGVRLTDTGKATWAELHRAAARQAPGGGALDATRNPAG